MKRKKSKKPPKPKSGYLSNEAEHALNHTQDATMATPSVQEKNDTVEKEGGSLSRNATG